MKILFLGGSGVISRAATQQTIAAGHELWLLNRGQRRPIAGAHSLVADLTDVASVRAALLGHTWDVVVQWIAFTPAEIAHMAKSLKMLIDPQCVAIVELNGEPVGFGIALPNLNELIADFGGRLLPFNWLKLLWRLRRGARTARVPLMGIRRSVSGSLVGGLAPFLVIDALRNGLRNKGVQQVELSWILEDNRSMRHVIESLGARAYKTYRVYEKELTR